MQARGLGLTSTLLMVVVATAWTLSGPTLADTISYDPERCSPDAGGRVFVRLMNGQSFAFPAEDLLGLRGRPGWPGEVFADPDEPVGCPLHPITSQSMAVAYRPVTPRNPAEPADRRWRPDVLKLITNPDAGGPHLLQESYLRSFNRSCINRAAEETHEHRLVDVSPALQECRIEQREKPDDGDWPSYLVALPGTHPEYEGRRFAVWCKHPYSLGGSRTCEARYRMKGDLGVMYRFQDALVPPEHMAEFDLAVRAFIEARRTPGYDPGSPVQGQ